jgi:glycosyltransferase involved in cell wall biosynthesis
MNILYDNQVFSMQKFGGISNYYMNLYKNFLPDVNILLPKMYSDNIYIKNRCQAKSNFFRNINFKGKNRIRNYLNQLFNILGIVFYKFDIYHPTYYDQRYLKLIPHNKLVVITVYDMIHELYPEWFPADSREYKAKKELCIRANKIIAISETTKRDLINIFQISADKIEVIYLATDFSICNNVVPTITWLPDNYCLFVGARYSYKNFNWMIEAIAPFLLKHNYKLVVIGIPFNNAEIELIHKLHLSQNIILNNVNEQTQLQEIYNRSKVFIFASIYEGFGIPILEGFASKTPVLLAKTECFVEIATDAALYFELNNKQDFIQQLEHIVFHHNVRNDLINKGIDRIKKFSWKNTSLQTQKLYNKLLYNEA